MRNIKIIDEFYDDAAAAAAVMMMTQKGGERNFSYLSVSQVGIAGINSK